MLNWNIYLATETEKYDFIAAVRAAGAKLTGVSGCGPGYYIQFDATQGQADYIEKNLVYTGDSQHERGPGLERLERQPFDRRPACNLAASTRDLF